MSRSLLRLSGPAPLDVVDTNALDAEGNVVAGTQTTSAAGVITGNPLGSPARSGPVLKQAWNPQGRTEGYTWRATVLREICPKASCQRHGPG